MNNHFYSLKKKRYEKLNGGARPPKAPKAPKAPVVPKVKLGVFKSPVKSQGRFDPTKAKEADYKNVQKVRRFGRQQYLVDGKMVKKYDSAKYLGRLGRRNKSIEFRKGRMEYYKKKADGLQRESNRLFEIAKTGLTTNIENRNEAKKQIDDIIRDLGGKQPNEQQLKKIKELKKTITESNELISLDRQKIKKGKKSLENARTAHKEAAKEERKILRRLRKESRFSKKEEKLGRALSYLDKRGDGKLGWKAFRTLKSAKARILARELSKLNPEQRGKLQELNNLKKKLELNFSLEKKNEYNELKKRDPSKLTLEEISKLGEYKTMERELINVKVKAKEIMLEGRVQRKEGMSWRKDAKGSKKKLDKFKKYSSVIEDDISKKKEETVGDKTLGEDIISRETSARQHLDKSSKTRKDIQGKLLEMYSLEKEARPDKTTQYDKYDKLINNVEFREKILSREARDERAIYKEQKKLEEASGGYRKRSVKKRKSQSNIKSTKKKRSGEKHTSKSKRTQKKHTSKAKRISNKKSK